MLALISFSMKVSVSFYTKMGASSVATSFGVNEYTYFDSSGEEIEKDLIHVK